MKPPTGKLGLQRIVLGNLPLLGISYQGRRKDREYIEKFSDKGEMKKIMRVALRHGVSLFAASSHGFNDLAPIHLDAVKEVEKEEETELSLISCIGIPLQVGGEKVNEYRRWKTHLNYELEQFGETVRRKAFEDPILNCRLGWKENLRGAKPYKSNQLKRELRVNWKLWEESIEKLSNHMIAWVEPGSETDFLAISRIDLLEELLDRIGESGYRSLLGSHHLGASFPLVEEWKVKRFDGYVTPINRLGVMMFPTQRDAEKAAERARTGGKLIAGIKPFAGGRIEPKEALEYVYKELKADSCMIGVGSVEEAEEDFRVARDVLASIRRP